MAKCNSHNQMVGNKPGMNHGFLEEIWLVHIGWGEFQEAVIGFMVDPCCRLGYNI